MPNLKVFILGILAAYLPSLQAAPGDLKWSFQTGGAVRSSPALGTNGLVYFGSSDSKLYALDAVTGVKRWELASSASIIASPAIGPDGTVFVGSTDGNLSACDGLSGKQRWSFVTGDALFSSPALGANGVLYVKGSSGTIFAVNSVSGKQIWTGILAGNGLYATPSVGPGGMVFCGGFKSLFAFDGATGGVRWKFDSFNSIQSTPAIGADGTVFIPSYDKFVYALDPLTGAKKWSYLTGDSVSSSPALGGDGTLYVGSNDGFLYAINSADGSEKWIFHTADTIHSSPAVAADDTVYFGSYDTKVYAVDGKTGVEKWHYLTGGLVLSSPVIGLDGTVFIGSQDGKLYALEAASPPAQSSWPAFKGGPQRTSSIELPGPPVMIAPPGKVLAAEGTPAFLDAVVQGSRPMSFQWLRNGQPLAPFAAWTTNSRLEILTARLTNSGSYTLIASNAFGEVRASGRLDVGFVLSTISGTGGQVKRAPDQEVYLPGTIVQITATPDSGRSFLGWHGDASGLANPYPITLRNHQTVSARFTVAPGEKLWDVPFLSNGGYGFAVGDDNTVFVAGVTTNLFALDGDTGLVRWQFNTTNPIDRAVAIAGDGTVVFALYPSFVYAVDGNTGAQKWKTTVAGVYTMTPAIGADGVVYVYAQPSGESSLVALQGTNGTVKWRYNAGRVQINSPPVVGTNGLVYLTTSCDTTVTALDVATGQSRWKTPLTGCWGSPPALGRDGSIYIQSGSFVYALAPTTGATLWKSVLPNGGGSVAPVVGPDEMVYLMNGYDGCIAIDGRSGQIKPAFKPALALNIWAVPPALAADGTLYATSSGRILALDGISGEAKWAASVPSINQGPLAIGPNGNIYAQSSSDTGQMLTALKGTSDLADAPWPMSGNNARNTSALNDSRPISITGLAVSSANVRVSFRSKLGRPHHLEFKNSLDDPQWRNALTVTGTGAELTLSDPQNINTRRFYRIRLE